MAVSAGRSSVRTRRGWSRPAGLRAATQSLLTCLLLLLAGSARAGDIRILGIEPSVADSTLRCIVLTSRIPDGPTRETLASGLPSSLTLTLTLIDASGRERAGSQQEIRLEPDPWERTFLLRLPASQRRVSDLDELTAALRRLGPLHVASIRRLDPRAPVRIRARLSVHALAPAEADRAHALFAGDLSGNGADRREVSAGMGSLLRFFLGRAPASPWDAQATSAPFTTRSLANTP